VTDIASDSLWVDYRAVALEHGLRACWSTPICDAVGAVIGTFAIYHLTPRSATHDEVAAIERITEHVARAISWSESSKRPRVQPTVERTSLRPVLKLVADTNHQREVFDDIAGKFDELVRVIDTALVDSLPHSATAYVKALTRARHAAEKGAALARSELPGS